jgi:hypothetical protein
MTWRFILLLSLVMLGIFLSPAQAGVNSGVVFSLGCEGFSGSGSITLNRDNTGQLREAFIVSATDGAGNLIYEPVEDSFFVGGSVSWDAGKLIPWDSAPQFNPLTLRVVSQDGNDLDVQTIVTASGSCSALLTFRALPLIFFINDGLTSSSLALNAVPPRPSNAPEDVAGLQGYLLVDTDNLWLRSGAGAEFTRVAIVDGGTRLIPLGRNADRSWWLVQAGDVVGWASSEFLRARGDLTAVPEVDSEGEVAPPRFFVFSRTTLWSAPDSASLPLCVIPGGLEYLVVGRDRNAVFYQIQASCDGTVVKGWVDAEQGAFRSDSGLPVPQTAP